MDTRKYNWEIEGTVEQFQKIYTGLDFMNVYPKDKKFRVIVHTNNPFEKLKLKWWLRFPPKKPKRNWYPE